MKKVFKIIGTVTFLSLIIGFISLTYIAPYFLLSPPKLMVNSLPEDIGLEAKPIEVQTFDSLTLKGYWINSEQEETKGIILLIHGIGGCKEHFYDLSKSLVEKGIATVVFDLRAHGKSDGEYCTYGFHEKKDISTLVDYIKSVDSEIPLGIWGNSLGGAIAIQALENDKRLEFGIIESTFTDLNQIAYDYKKRILKGFGSHLITDYVLERAAKIADFEPEKVKPIQSVKHITQPVLIAHGDADQNISFHYGEQLYRNLKSEKKEFVKVKGGGHFGLYDTGGKEYANKLLDFIFKHIN